MVKNNEHGESYLISTVEKCLDYSICHIGINYRPLKLSTLGAYDLNRAKDN